MFDIWSTDWRSLGLYRIVFGFGCIFDLLDRLSNLSFHYTDSGLVPRWIAQQHMEGGYFGSVYFISGSSFIVTLIFLIHLFIVILFTIGYKTRIMAILMWIFGVSLCARNNPVNLGADELIMHMYFWNIWLPLGKIWSTDNFIRDRNAKIKAVCGDLSALQALDYSNRKRYGDLTAKQNSEPKINTNNTNDNNINNTSNNTNNNTVKKPRRPFRGISIAGFIIQFFLMYFFSFWKKTGNTWKTGDATYFALNIDYLRLWPVGDFLVSLPMEVLRVFTFGVLTWELMGGFFYLIPSEISRLIGSFGFISMHAGFGSAMGLGSFTPIAISGNLVMLPPIFWEFLHKIGILSKMESFGHWFGGKIMNILEFLELILPLTGNVELPVPQTTKIVKKNSSTKPLKQTFKIILHILAILVILIVIHWNLEINNFIKHSNNNNNNNNDKLFPIIVPFTLPNWYLDMRVYLRLGQNWGMFSTVPENVWWYVVDGYLLNGYRVDIWGNGGLFSWPPISELKFPGYAEKNAPNIKSAIGSSHRWWKFYERFNDGDERDHLRKRFADIICTEWNNRFSGGDQLKSIIVNWIKRDVLLDGTRAPPAAPLTLWTADCNNYDKNYVNSTNNNINNDQDSDKEHEEL